jgi:hypothetical protein
MFVYIGSLRRAGFHHRRRDIGVVVHHLPSSTFTPVDGRDPPIDEDRLTSKLPLTMFGAQCVGDIVSYGNYHQVIHRHLPIRQ